jgi:hypothetical protein
MTQAGTGRISDDSFREVSSVFRKVSTIAQRVREATGQAGGFAPTDPAFDRRLALNALWNEFSGDIRIMAGNPAVGFFVSYCGFHSAHSGELRFTFFIHRHIFPQSGMSSLTATRAADVTI